MFILYHNSISLSWYNFYISQFVSSMNPSADVLALASAEFDVSSVPEGNTITVKWRGKPIFIRHRTAAEIAKEAEVDISTLRDPETDASRTLDPAWYVTVEDYPISII